MSTKFPPVKALKAILGIAENTELVFDYNLAKYVSRVESEDIGDDSYYYSGSAVAIDPYVVKANIGEFFEYVNDETKIDLLEGEIDVAYEVKDEKEEDFHIHSPKEFPELDTSEWVEWTKGDLVMTCHNCGNVDLVAESIEGGIQSILPVDNHNVMRLVCSQCNSAMSLHFVKSADGVVKEYIEAETDEEDLQAPMPESEVQAESAEVEIEEVIEDNDESPKEA